MNFQLLFDHMSEKHGLTLTESQITDIILVCREILETRTCCNCNEAVTMVSNGCICPNCYKEQ